MSNAAGPEHSRGRMRAPSNHHNATTSQRNDISTNFTPLSHHSPPCVSLAPDGTLSASTSSTSDHITAATVARDTVAELQLRRWSMTFARIAGIGWGEGLGKASLELSMPLDGMQMIG